MNPIKQKAYKLVRVQSNGKRVSCLGALDMYPEFLVRYPVNGNIVRPKVQGTSLFVFDSMNHANEHRWTLPREFTHEIWEVEAFGIKPISSVYRIWWNTYNLEQIKKFWNRTYNHQTLEGDLCASGPSGTHICKSLRMVKKVA